MERDRDIQPVGPVTAILRAKPLGKVRLFKRPGYMPKLKQATKGSPKEEADKSEEVINHAHYTPEGIGERIDFKV